MSVVFAWTHDVSAYRNGRCRCPRCRDRQAVRCKAERDARRERLARDPSLAPHGRNSTYVNWDCRCDPCTDANTAKCRAYRERRKREVAR